MKIVFMGTPHFAATGLKKLLDNRFNIKAVFTPVDKPKGRGYKIEESPVKKLSIENNIKVFQPLLLNNQEVKDMLKELSPDVIIVIAYGVILPKDILEIPKYGCINVHASLLPKYRGAAPVQWSIIKGEKVTGITTMFMDEGLDTGDIILQSMTDINPNETAGELMGRLAEIGASTLIKTLKMIENNDIVRIPQEGSQSSWAPILKKDICKISFNTNAEEIHNLIRGLNPWPIAKISLNGNNIKIYNSQIIETLSENKNYGEIIDSNEFIISCSKGLIKFNEIQIEGGKRMATEEFLKGHKIKKGDYCLPPI